MAKGESKLGFRLTRKRIAMGILTADLLAKYNAVQEAEAFKAELAAAAKTAQGFKVSNRKDAVDPTKALRTALQNVNAPEKVAAFVGIKRGPGRPKGSTNKVKVAAVLTKRPVGRPRKEAAQDNTPYIPIHLRRVGQEKARAKYVREHRRAA